jgi:16S rRNA (guanine(966)-N(2))-methyltransferase RsmD
MADAGRVIAGRAAGRRLAAPPGEGTRPLADRVKQTLFAILEPDLDGARVLDLFAGSGAAGIEALSRGAAGAVFVERDGRAATTIAENLRATALAGPDATIVGAEALAWLRRDTTAAQRFDVVIVDPPYAETDLLAAVLARLGEADAPLAPGARVVAKHFWRDRPPGRIGLLASERERRFGETTLTFYRRVAEEVG